MTQALPCHATLTDLFTDDPMSAPLTYPGRLPQTSGLLQDESFPPLTEVAGAPAADWRIEAGGHAVRLDDHLAALGAAPMSARHAVVAVGSNAAPSQLHRKFVAGGLRPVVPLTRSTVRGIAPGVSAHVNRNGYVPAAPITARTASRLFVLWVDQAQLAVLDRTEPNYHRRVLPPRTHPVTLASGVAAPLSHLYAGRHGCLVDQAGRPMRLDAQAPLITRLLARSAELRRLCGTSPEAFVTRVQKPVVRETAYHLFRSLGLAREQPELLNLPAGGSGLNAS
ncbi:hypothetical protein AB0B45_12440 [Nonomuraea sp. NPDC049152]|uniref:hypothetical protein n=1 Tax=Nonomuraea sp. NPDC049152 TaxID=3154350 RepID=UPI003411CAE8